MVCCFEPVVAQYLMAGGCYMGSLLVSWWLGSKGVGKVAISLVRTLSQWSNFFPICPLPLPPRQGFSMWPCLS